ncbi:CPBP family glutamic-type intramembrane protease [Rubellicoccus peritrichatus]|uniref:CPBP family glutamic-type intramembrane protease n=1 Tax=Rubellicoccus peritrichatus TaxID=3080537 RepID=A0AAQ3L7L3_9BACT|nr:CPBP family glutamic-type intramembrane protease [Puniceicoccus sp. CR14]WOO41099.1 CPBP family glutamic-type intramembrane protease [Puniceicoccus sp. CR14]
MSQDAHETSTTIQAADNDLSEEDNLSAMQNDPLMIIVMFGVSVYLAKLWLDDFRSARAGKAKPGAFPGAVGCSRLAIGVAVAGALVLLALETGGEYALGVVSEQSDITALALLSLVSAAFFEELIFRGYLVVDKKGKAPLIASIVGFSLIFTVIHPFLWELDYPEGVAGWQFWEANLTFNFTEKAWFSTIIVFLNSLWFYSVRFFALNPAHSLIPCMAAHLASNLGVFLIKLFQGHVVGLW